MDVDDLKDAVLGLSAYDMGSTDSGIHDPVLRARVLEILRNMDPQTFRLTVSRLFRDAFLSEDALRAGYGIEDARNLMRWFERNGIDL
jgi:hypothetical protein